MVRLEQRAAPGCPLSCAAVPGRHPRHLAAGAAVEAAFPPRLSSLEPATWLSSLTAVVTCACNCADRHRRCPMGPEPVGAATAADRTTGNGHVLVPADDAALRAPVLDPVLLGLQDRKSVV